MLKDSFKKYAFAFAIPALMLASCGSDDPDPNDGGNAGDGGNTEPTETVDGLLSSSEAFDYIQSTAEEAISLFRPEDQKEVMEVCKAFDEAYGEYDFMGGDDYDYSPAGFMKTLRKGMRNPLYLTRASYYVYRIDEFAGIYTPNDYRQTWERTGDSKDIICRCDLNGKEFEAKMTWSSDSWEVPVDEEEAYAIPSTITVTVTYGGKQLAKETIESNASLEGHRAALKISYEVANIQSVSDFNGTDSQLKETANVYVGGKRLYATEFTVNGNGLCDINAWAGLEDPTPAQVAAMFRNGEFSINILDRIFFTGSAAGLNKVYEALNFYEESYNTSYSKNEAKKQCEKACNTLNSNLKAEIKFAGSNAVQGSLTFVPYVYEEKGSSWWDVYPAAAIKYAADNSIEVLEDTDYDFSVIEEMFNNLVNNYQRFFERLK